MGFILGVFLLIPLYAQAAVLFMEPASGTFQVGSTFAANVYLDTQGASINAISVEIQFPPDRLQITNPSSGNSVVGIWSEVPSYNNQKGTLSLVGALPKGMVASRALITTLSLRAKAVGEATIKISDESRVLLNDGKGTDALGNVVNAFIKLVLPPPAGPAVFSATHPDQDHWYKEESATFSWESDAGIQGYSYVLNELPIDTPDSISEGGRTSVSYKNFGSGLYYFHIKALRDGTWGGVTHYAIHNDVEPPAAFPVVVLPGEKTVRRQPILQFQTSDVLSGIDRYEIKLVPLTAGGNPSGNEPLFFEAQSPFVTPELLLGSYDVILRAVDKAGNFYDSVKNFQIVETIFGFAEEGGLLFRSNTVIAWGWVLGGLGVLIVLLLFGIIFIKRWHRSLDTRRETKALPGVLTSQLEKLKKYRERYGKMALLLFLCLSLSWGSLAPVRTRAEDIISPPVISVVSQNISDDEMFYITGRSKFPKSTIVLYIQNEVEGTIITRDITPDANGEWFYQHSTPFNPGEYSVWLQTRVGEELSPPSAKTNLSVGREAFRLGSSRISYETLYLYIALILFLAVVGLVVYVVLHGTRAHKKRRVFLREVREAEESIIRGFAVLRRDIQAELALVHKAKMTRELTVAERAQEEHLMKDLVYVEQHVKKEVWDLEHIQPNTQ